MPECENYVVALVIDFVLTHGMANYMNLLSSSDNKSVIFSVLLAKSSVENILVAASHF